MKRTAVINVVGLSDSCLGPKTPRLNDFISRNRKVSITPAFPAVTCTAQSNYVTGQLPSAHGIVGNGWYNREHAEVQFWKQSNHIVHGPKIWDDLRAAAPGFTCAKLFWWYNMYSTADYSITPRPMYPADGRKVFDIYTHPFSIRTEIKNDLGEFPFPAFWGPAAGTSGKFQPDQVSRWIADSAKWIENKYQPTLSLVYLPHLDYNLQRLGPAHPEVQNDYARIDSIVGDLIYLLRIALDSGDHSFRIRHQPGLRSQSTSIAFSAKKAGSRSRTNSASNCSMQVPARSSLWPTTKSRTFTSTIPRS